ncbi:MAG: PD-(D/E)XK nuclease family protein, partial [Desulfobacterales bacterium]
SKHRLDHDLQLTAYHLAAPMMGLGDAPVTLQLLLSGKEPSLESYQPARSERDHHDLLTIVSGVLKAIDAGAFYPVREWHCQSCPYAGPCLAG